MQQVAELYLLANASLNMLMQPWFHWNKYKTLKFYVVFITYAIRKYCVCNSNMQINFPLPIRQSLRPEIGLCISLRHAYTSSPSAVKFSCQHSYTVTTYKPRN